MRFDMALNCACAALSIGDAPFVIGPFPQLRATSKGKTSLYSVFIDLYDSRHLFFNMHTINCTTDLESVLSVWVFVCFRRSDWLLG